QRKFVDAIVAGKTNTKAAQIAGYGTLRPDQAASRLIVQPLIRVAIEQRGMQAARDAGVDSSRVLRRLARIAFNDRAKHTDQIRASELLGKHLKLFTEKHEHTGKDGVPLPAPTAAAPVILMTPEAAKEITKQLLAGV
ncbi:MAG: terminase small subunit, partial [Pseudomonadota bacterium]